MKKSSKELPISNAKILKNLRAYMRIVQKMEAHFDKLSELHEELATIIGDDLVFLSAEIDEHIKVLKTRIQ